MDANSIDLSSEISAWDQSIGLGDSSDSDSQADTPALAAADRDALKAAAEQPVATLTPSQQAEQTETGDTPEYLKPLLDEKPQPATVDWEARYKEQFGAEAPLPEGKTIDADVFYGQLQERESEREILSQTEGYAEYKALLTRDYSGNEDAKAQDDLALVQNRVRQQLGENHADSEFDAKMGFYAEEGKLNADGVRLADSLRGSLANWIKTTEETARSQAKTLSDKTLTARSEYRQFVDSFKPLDVELEKEDSDFVKDLALSGGLDERLSNLTKEEIALITIALTPHLRGKYFALAHYQRGAEEGGKKKLASKLGLN